MTITQRPGAQTSHSFVATQTVKNLTHLALAGCRLYRRCLQAYMYQIPAFFMFFNVFSIEFGGEFDRVYVIGLNVFGIACSSSKGFVANPLFKKRTMVTLCDLDLGSIQIGRHRL